VDGICSYLGETCGDIPISSTNFVETPTLASVATGDVCASGWYTYTNQRAQTATLTPNLGTLELPTHTCKLANLHPV